MTSFLQAIHRANPHPFANFFPTSPIGWLGMVVLYVGIFTIQNIPYFFLYKKATISKPGLTFVPILELIPYFWTLKKSPWNTLWFISPVIGFIVWRRIGNSLGLIIFIVTILLILVLHYIWKGLFFRAFGMSPLWLLLLPSYLFVVLPIVGQVAPLGFLILNYVMAFGSKYQYQLQNKGR